MSGLQKPIFLLYRRVARIYSKEEVIRFPYLEIWNGVIGIPHKRRTSKFTMSGGR